MLSDGFDPQRLDLECWHSGHPDGRGCGGQGGIRTHDTVSRIHAFQASAFSQLGHLSGTHVMAACATFFKRETPASGRSTRMPTIQKDNLWAGFGSGPARCIVPPPHRSGRRERHQTDLARGFWTEPVRGARKNPAARSYRRSGSISQAGRTLGMSYRRAWLLIDDMNQCFRHAVVSASRRFAGRGCGADRVWRGTRPRLSCDRDGGRSCGEETVARARSGAPEITGGEFGQTEENIDPAPQAMKNSC